MDNKKSNPTNKPGTPQTQAPKPACKCGGKNCNCKNGGGCKDNCGTPHKK